MYDDYDVRETDTGPGARFVRIVDPSSPYINAKTGRVADGIMGVAERGTNCEHLGPGCKVHRPERHSQTRVFNVNPQDWTPALRT
jgi:hypothetical protein